MIYNFVSASLSLLILSVFNQVSSERISRHFYYHLDGTDYYKEHNVTISSSSYLTQRLINDIVRHLLNDELGYRSVTYSEKSLENVPPPTSCSHQVSFEYGTTMASVMFNDWETEDNSSTVNGNDTCIALEIPPPALIHMQPSADPIPADFTDVGSIGLSARHGVYMSSSLANELNANGGPMASYAALTNSSVISKLSGSNQRIIQEVTTSRGLTDSRCSDDSCFVFDFSPEVCGGASCAILLVGSFELPKTELEAIIEKLELKVNILYVEGNLASLVKSLSSSVHLLFFTIHPDLLTLDLNFTRIRSYDGECKLSDYDCHFPVIEMRKTLWTKLIKTEPFIYKLLKNVHLTDSEIAEMLMSWSARAFPITPFNIQRFVQIWLQQHPDKVAEWIPSDASEKPELYIGGFFPIWEYSGWRDVTVSIAAEMAVDLVNKDSKVLADHTLRILVNDSRCDSSYVLKTFMQYVTDDNVWPKMVGGLGPMCDDTAIDMAGLAMHYNYVMVSYAVGAIVLSYDRGRYKYFYRTVPQMEEYADVYVSLFKKLEWTHYPVSLITDDSSGEFPFYHSKMSAKFSDEGITLATQQLLPKMQYLQEDPDAYGKYLEKIKNASSYIIIMDVYEDVAAKIMCEAYKMKMTMEYNYIWFLPDQYQFDWYDPAHIAQSVNIACTRTEMDKAVTGYLSLAHDNIDKTGTVAVGGMTGTTFETEFKARVKDETGLRFPSEYGSYAYDAVWTFAKAVDALYEENPAYLKYIHTSYVAERYLEKLNSLSFNGVSGTISFNSAGQRSGRTIIKTYNETASDDYLFATKIGTWSNGAIELYGDIDFRLPQNPYPSLNPPTCEWENMRQHLGLESCVAALFVVVIPPIVVIIVLIVIIAMCIIRSAKRKYRFAAELASNLGAGQSYSMYLNFDEKEISRDHVVLNRKLGQGAFGTVYGGEAYIKGVWTGIAVKTLKVGSNSEDKLDFLREADIMKRFDHKNVVKLLGVTTRGEPAYAIMEFMLYGDLKTYLLSRREHVGRNTKEVEEVSASSLTRMATDVIEGLGYLHTKEYIHRDIACRNCLISANRTVKIGDFGMTRRVYDDGSYMFTRRGRMPVRWMAPESFVDGLFTYKTDMWSYGVLLYEIITFGSIPYHMLTNAEVFDSVKAGKTLTLPEECTDELKSLLLACWDSDPMQRPNPYDIYATLTNNENIIQPLLSCPALAKIRECDSEELDLSPTILKTSTMLKKSFLRQSSSIISVDTGMTFTRHRNHSEILHRRSNSNRRRSSHSIVDLLSLVNPYQGHPSTPLSLPSPSHSPETSPTFNFSPDNRYARQDGVWCDKLNCRTQHNSGSTTASMPPAIAENDYLLTTRSCTEIDEHSSRSHAPLIPAPEETAI